jgi:hypothetical protein
MILANQNIPKAWKAARNIICKKNSDKYNIIFPKEFLLNSAKMFFSDLKSWGV